MLPLRAEYPIPPRQDGRSSQNRERGQTLVEFALILLILLWILFAILDLGRAVYAYHVVANAAREGARQAMLFVRVWPADEDHIKDVVREYAIGLDLDPDDITITRDLTAKTVRVDVEYPFRLVTPLIAKVIGKGTLVLHSSSTMYTGY